MPLAEPEPERLASTLAGAGLGGSLRTWDVAPYLELSGSWEEYTAGRSANFRSDLKRKRKRLEQAGAVRVERFRDPEGVRGALPAAAEVERHSWKQAAGTARLTGERGFRFLEEAAVRLAGRGWTDLWILRCGEMPVAFYLNFLWGDSVCYYSGTYRSDFQSASPGKLLMAEVIRTAFAEGFARFDFLRGAEAYKATWTEQSRPLYEAFVHSGGLRSRAATGLLGSIALPLKRRPRGQALVARLQRLRAR